MGSRYFGSEQPAKPHIDRRAVSGELQDLRNDVEHGFVRVQTEMDAGPAPGAHHASHVTGSDQLADATATGPVHGLMAGADKVKLDGIEAGADVTSAHNPKAHASSHVTGAGDVIADAVAAGNSGLMSGAMLTKLNGIEASADVTASHAPQAHAASHVSGADQIADATATGPVHGLMPGADKTKLDSITVANIPSAGEKAALAGTDGSPSGANKFVTNSDPRLVGMVPAGAPELDLLNVSGGAAINHVGGDIKLVGRNLLQGQTFDSIHLTEVGGADLTLYALKPGPSLFTVQIVAGAGALSMTFVGGALVITLAAAGSTDDAVATLINANAAATDGYVRAVSAGGGTFTLAQAAAPMAGGTGDYAHNKVMVAGLEALPANTPGTNAAAKWSDSGITCTTQAAGAATDVAAVRVESAALWTAQISGVMI